ncbi:MAG TPA: hypothetical protein VGH36_06125 [Acetobacteraceae bacterium]|jgi:hypothetical protein
MNRFRRILLVAGWLVPLGLTGCSGPALDTPEGQCESTVEQDPTVKAAENRDLWAKVRGPGYDVADGGAAALKRQKMTECLRTRGVSPPGGVQRLQQY